jgi:ankyrin repeat protein
MIKPKNIHQYPERDHFKTDLDYEQYLLRNAMHSNDTKAIKVLLNKNPQLLHELHEDSNTTMMCKMQKYMFNYEIDTIRPMIEFLLAQGAKVNQQSGNGDTLLHWALRVHNVEDAFIVMLLDSGASMSIQNNKGNTPLDELSKIRKPISSPTEKARLRKLELIRLWNEKSRLENSIKNNKIKSDKTLLKM